MEQGRRRNVRVEPKRGSIGKVPYKLLQTRFPDSLESMKASLMSKDRWEGELVQAKLDGAEIVVASRQVLRRDEHGKPLDVLEINIDITAQKRAEAQLREAQKMEALGILTGGIAHDFNNILAAMIGFAELAKDRALKGGARSTISKGFWRQGFAAGNSSSRCSRSAERPSRSRNCCN